MVDAPAGVLGLEWIDGRSVRFLLGDGDEGEVEEVDASELENDQEEAEEAEDPLPVFGVSQGAVSSLISKDALSVR
jgi:TP53 regulating kinase and related kinases